jgi:2-polyprenyl-6-methoxyphenol hydroxylase-like FAD-dependent oxidoreductase
VQSVLRAHVAIAGGGIGGLTLASALRRSGIGVTVYERAQALRPAGAGITVQANAMAALRTLGLDEAVAAQGQVAGEALILDAAGRVLQAVETEALQRELGAPIVCIHRSRLHQVLLDACGAENVRTGCAVVGYGDLGEGVSVHLSDGSVANVDLLVGADGIHSTVRTQLLGEQPLRYSGYTSWRGVCRDPELGAITRTSESWGVGKRFGIVPIGQGEVYWFATANAPEGQQDPPGRTREGLLERFAGWHEPIERLIERTAEADLLRTDIHDRPPVRSWSKGRVVLLGDAAHPMTPNLGQGGCQAIEDAVVLARALAKLPSVGDALQRYEGLRVERANGIVKKSYALGRLGQLENRAAILLRNALLRWTPAAVARKQFKQAMAFDLRAR